MPDSESVNNIALPVVSTKVIFNMLVVSWQLSYCILCIKRVFKLDCPCQNNNAAVNEDRAVYAHVGTAICLYTNVQATVVSSFHIFVS